MFVWDKLKNKVLGALVLILVSLVLVFSYQSHNYKDKYETASAQVVQLEGSLSRANNTIKDLNQNKDKTNNISVKRQEDRKQITTVDKQKQEQLNAAIKNNPDWANAVVSDSVLESLKTN